MNSMAPYLAVFVDSADKGFCRLEVFNHPEPMEESMSRKVTNPARIQNAQKCRHFSMKRLVVAAVIMFAGHASADAQDYDATDRQTVGQSGQFNFYRIPGDAEEINISISEMLEGCPTCNQVDPFPPPTWIGCDLPPALNRLSNELGEAIQTFHLTHDLNLEDLRNTEQDNCNRMILEFRIYLAVQIINM